MTQNNRGSTPANVGCSSHLKMVLPVDGFDDIIRSVPLERFDSILDVGIGAGAGSAYFADHGKKVTAIGLNVDAYSLPPNLTDKISLLRCDLMSSSLDNLRFDAVWFSHCLEHMPNPGLALERIHKLLNPGGWLFICVPPYSPRVQGGHLITGWNVGQLIYFLLLCGFDVRNGHFVSHGYNIAGFVRKSEQRLPPLNYDRGDIELLKDYLPQEITAVNAFDGDINAVNWIGFKTPINPQVNSPARRSLSKNMLRGLRSTARPLFHWLRRISQ
ncbi:MAG: class I SAM-dependent methyltransferase [Elusimicrobia bacterium]|nr:class I SAM-dependent methyltransferase [Elusimicrobiota bacterium]